MVYFKPLAYTCRSYFLTHPMLQTLDFKRSDRYCHYNTENAYARGLTGVAFSIHPEKYLSLY